MGAIKQGGQGLKIRFQSNRLAISNGQVAQLVEQRTENPRVGGSIPPLATISPWVRSGHLVHTLAGGVSADAFAQTSF
jgi:hypothetical protein